MSYILEALKKSEQERRRGEVPEINRFDTAAEDGQRRFPVWTFVVAVLVIVNVTVLFVWAPWETSPADTSPALESGQTQQRPANSMESEQDASSQSAANAGELVAPVNGPTETVKVAPANLPRIKPREPVKAPASQAEPQSTQSVEPEIIRPNRQPDPAPVAEPEPEVIRPSYAPEPEVIRPRSAPQTSYLPQLEELPDDIQRLVPDMSFSSHMYSSEPRFRSIIINGRRLKEGQFLNDQIQVREITDKGVILSLDGTVFEVDVLGQWVN